MQSLLTFEVPLYGGWIRIITDPTEYQEVTDTDEDLNCRGIADIGFDNTTNIYYIGVFDETLTTLVHEIFHTTLTIIAQSGFNGHDANSEPGAYLCDHIFRVSVAMLRQRDGEGSWAKI